MLKDFIEKTAKKPRGNWALKFYANPRAHLPSFRLILDALQLDQSDRYCEIGSGGGLLLNMAMTMAGSGAAIDHSKEMVALASEKNRGYINQGRLEIIQGNAESLPWEENSFTACASANMFFFVEHPEAMLEEVFRILAPGGRFSMVTLGKGLVTGATFGWLYRLNTYSESTMKAMMEEAGFSQISVRTKKCGMVQTCYGEKVGR